MRKGSKSGLTPLERFWELTRKTETCWIWTGYLSRNGEGTGQIQIGKKTVKAHRFAYEQFVGPIPDGMYICHHCDNPSCVNPEHLFLGTQADNMADMVNKDRSNKPKGESNGRAVLTEENVRTIRASHDRGVSLTALSTLYGVTSTTIRNIVQRKLWPHLEERNIEEFVQKTLYG